MAKRKNDTAVRTRISTQTLERWRAAAEESGLTLSAWIRLRVDGMEIRVAGAPLPPRKVG